MIRSYCFRLQTSKRIGRVFEQAVATSNEIYNAALEERIGAWKKQKISINKFDQFKSLTLIRKNDDRFSRYAAAMLRAPLVLVDEAFKGFFSRTKKGGKSGFPRFRNLKRLRSFGFTQADGWKLNGKVLSMKGMPKVRLKMHRDLQGKPLTLTIKKTGRGCWLAVIVVRLPSVFGPTSQGALGFDLGVENLVTDSNGIAFGRLSPDCEADRLKIEQSLARKKKGSKRWRQAQKSLARQRYKEACVRKTQHFQVASRIIKSGPQIIVVEDLKLRNMTRSAKGTIGKPGKNVAAKSGLNRSILDAGMGQFVKILTDKAESAGRLVIAIDPRNTSQMCSDCGEIVKKTLRLRWHSCFCGAEYHRDHNAARNVLHRGVVAPVLQVC